MTKIVEYFDALLNRSAGTIRYTQHLPILPDVWMECVLKLGKPHELLLTPHEDSTAAELTQQLRRRWNEIKSAGENNELRYVPDQKPRPQGPRIAHNETSVVATLFFHEIIQAALPLSGWWSNDLFVGDGSDLVEQFMDGERDEAAARMIAAMNKFHGSDHLAKRERGSKDIPVPSEGLAWMGLVVGSLALIEEMKIEKPNISEEMLVGELWRLDYKTDPVERFGPVVDALFGLLAPIRRAGKGPVCLSKINRNRNAEINVFRSLRTVKADAVQTLFDVSGKGVRWAVIDSGIDATHIAFRRRCDTGHAMGPLSFRRKNPTTTKDGKIQQGAIRRMGGKPTYEYSHIMSFDLQGEPVFSADQDMTRNSGKSANATASSWGAFVPELNSHGRPKPHRWMNQTRVLKTYDFTLIRDWLGAETIDDLPPNLKARLADVEKRERDNTGLTLAQARRTIGGNLEKALKFGQMIDWELMAKLLEVHHDDTYGPPRHHHGTHVAGVLGADWRASENGLSPEADRIGIAPEIELYDLRALDANGKGDEFTLLAAMQFVRGLNTRHTTMQIHGVNMSLSISHKVASYACGCTPVCEEVERLVGSGVVVVTAAGNSGRAKYLTSDNSIDEGYRDASITDPGNAEAAITVGATHRTDQHSFGVSYFSSRGPTGDGRAKPDLVAPGEQIYSTVPDNGEAELDGTSMAAPHVSGAAALLIQRNMELMGQPRKIKEILCNSATDLGRERYYQGAGALDILRAQQSI